MSLLPWTLEDYLMLNVKVIYNGGYIPTLGIVQDGQFKNWLVYKHHDGQWVTLADLNGALC